MKLFTTILAGIFLSVSCYTHANDEKKAAITVSSKIDTEGALLGNLIVQALNDSGIPTINRLQMGNTRILRQAISSAAIDIYPEYTGNGAFIFGMEADPVWKNAEKGYQRVSKLDKEHNQLIWLMPAPVSNGWGIAVRNDIAEKNGLHSLSDFSRWLKHGGNVRLAASAEFIERADALPAFEKAYGFTLTDKQLVALAGGDTAQTLRAAAMNTSGVNAAMSYGTDGELVALELTLLSDPEGIQPVYAPTPVVRAEVLHSHPEIANILDPIFATLDAKTLQSLNARIAVNGEEAGQVAHEYLMQKRLIKHR